MLDAAYMYIEYWELEDIWSNLWHHFQDNNWVQESLLTVNTEFWIAIKLLSPFQEAWYSIVDIRSEYNDPIYIRVLERPSDPA